MHTHPSPLVRKQLSRIVLLLRKISDMAVEHQLQQPVLFAGMAVYFHVHTEHFRTRCKQLSNDIDFLITEQDARAWADLLALDYQDGKSDYFQGIKLKGTVDAVEVDMLAGASSRFPGYDPDYVFPLDISCAQAATTVDGDLQIGLMAPAELAVFKLLLGRGKSAGKYDFEDAAALIVDTGIQPEELFAVFARGITFSDEHRQFVRNRLQRCAGHSPNLFGRYLPDFLTAIEVWGRKKG